MFGLGCIITLKVTSNAHQRSTSAAIAKSSQVSGRVKNLLWAFSFFWRLAAGNASACLNPAELRKQISAVGTTIRIKPSKKLSAYMFINVYIYRDMIT